MILLLKFSSLRELQLIVKYFKINTKKFPLSQSLFVNAIWKNATDNCSNSCIARITDGYWDGYNEYTSSGPGSKDDWSKRYNVPIHTIDYVIEHFPELLI